MISNFGMSLLTSLFILWGIAFTFSFTIKDLAEVQEGSLYPDDYLHDMYHSALRKLSMKAKTQECRNWIEFEFMKYLRSQSDEGSALPFEDVFFHSQCDSQWSRNPPMLPIYMTDIPPKPPVAEIPKEVEESELDPETLAIFYVLLIHDKPDFAERIVKALYEPQHTFVFHVDLKAKSVFKKLKQFASTRNNIFLVDSEREQVNWGGFSVVNATLAAMRTGWQTNRHFDYMVLFSGTSYPIKSNQAIREALAKKPNAVYMDVTDDPARPPSEMWHHFVECDGALHRIGRLPIVRGMNMHIGSQWFSIPRYLVDWYLHNSLPYEYTFYAQHLIVADENYFQTLFKNSPYCHNLVNKNFLFVLFDKWENERVSTFEERDPRKCLNPHPDLCGRSPTTLTMAYKKLLEISRDLFARKFDPINNSSLALLDEIDRWRSSDYVSTLTGDEGSSIMVRQPFIKTRLNESGSGDYCLEMSSDVGAHVQLVKCDPASPKQWFTLGPCTDNSNVTIIDGKCPIPQINEEEMFCQLQSSNRNLCLDISGESPQAGNSLIGWECTGHWNQLFRFGSNCSLSAVQPDLIGRVRGFDDVNITICLESTYTNTVATSTCASNSVVLDISENPEDAMEYMKFLREKVSRQQFQYLKKDGKAFKEYVKLTSTSAPTPARRIVNYDNIPTAIKEVLEKSYEDEEELARNNIKNNKSQSEDIDGIDNEDIVEKTNIVETEDEDEKVNVSIPKSKPASKSRHFDFENDFPEPNKILPNNEL